MVWPNMLGLIFYQIYTKLPVYLHNKFLNICEMYCCREGISATTSSFLG